MIQLRSTAVSFDALAPFGDVGILQALAREDLPGFPRFDPRVPEPASDSPYLDRAGLARVVGDANPHLAPPSPKTYYVIAGQQAGLMLGPLYTFLKAVAAIGLAKEAQAHRDEPVAPLFWVASEDHDFLEVNHFEVFGKRFSHEADVSLTRGRMPQVADISLKNARAPLLAFLERALPDTEFRPQVLDLVAETDFADYAAAAHSLLKRLFAAWKLRTIDPITLRPFSSPVLADLADKWEHVAPAMHAGARRLEDAGLTPPLDSASIFDVSGGARRMVLNTSIAPSETSSSSPAPSRPSSSSPAPSRPSPSWPSPSQPRPSWPSPSGTSPAELARIIRQQPEHFSPSAALRPVLQDAVIPVLATLGGPSELAYLWQILPIYDLVGVHPSRRHPRLSVTFVEPAIARAARKAGLEGTALVHAPEAMRRLGAKLKFEPTRPLGDPSPDVTTAEDPPTATDVTTHADVTTDANPTAAIDETPDAKVIARVTAVAEEDADIRRVAEYGQRTLEAIDALATEPVPRWLRKGRDSIAGGLDRVVSRLHEERQTAASQQQKRLQKISEALFPGNRLQERSVNLLQFLNQYGFGFVDAVVRELGWPTDAHRLVEIVQADHAAAAGDMGDQQDGD